MSKKIFLSFLALMVVGGFLFIAILTSSSDNKSVFAQEQSSKSNVIKLPLPKYDGTVSIEKALFERRSIRTYKNEPLTLEEVSQILWAAQGITEPKTGKRTAPSAMASYFLELYLISGNVTGLPLGLYKYSSSGHELIKITQGDVKGKLSEAVGQAPLKNAPAVLVFTGLTEKAKNPNWIYLEAGHSAQNVYLQAVSLKMGTVVMAGFKEEKVREALNLSQNEQPIYLMPLGKK